MMRARSLAEWKEAMRIRALVTSNYTYADRAGNIFYLWNAALPLLPHAVTGDTVPTPATTMRDLWTRYVPFDKLPQLRNPRGGYLHNENDSPHYANVRAPRRYNQRVSQHRTAATADAQPAWDRAHRQQPQAHLG